MDPLGAVATGILVGAVVVVFLLLSVGPGGDDAPGSEDDA